jgi:hypothetical protein
LTFEAFDAHTAWHARLSIIRRDRRAAQAAETEEAEGQGEKAMMRWLRFEERACETIDWAIVIGWPIMILYSLGVF